MIDVEANYNSRIDEATKKIEQSENSIRFFPLMRLVLFFLVTFLFYRFVENQNFWIGIIATAVFILFLAIGIRDYNVKIEILRLKKMRQMFLDEIAALNGDFTTFDGGSRFVDTAHPYSHDLDLFGENSLFQAINRSFCDGGAARLARSFCKAFDLRNDVCNRQESIRELSNLFDFRTNMRLVFESAKESNTELSSFNSWLSDKRQLKYPRFLSALVTIFPILTIVSLIVAIVGFLSFNVVLTFFMFQLFFVSVYGRMFLKTHQSISSNYQIISRYAKVLSIIEKQNFASSHLKHLQQTLLNGDSSKPSKVIKQLANLLNFMDSNLNVLVTIVLNGFFMFNLHLLLKIERWRTKNREIIPIWFDTIAEIDALSSLANFAYNHPKYHYPTVNNNEFCFCATEIGHPLIFDKPAVLNNVNIEGWQQFAIITGANMSGKSTFLRTVGINLLLAMVGAPVFARNMRFSPVEIFSSIRTSDSLAKSESYFYAELKRLKEIINHLNAGKQIFILLDEILKGTNSKDKQNGSIALINQLMRYKVAALFATHDLALGKLMQIYPNNIQNLCFEIEIVDDKMFIDYKLRDGVCQHLNASFLMKKMGIILDEN